MIVERIKSIKFIEGLSKGDKIEFEFPFFMLYLKAITSGTISRVLMLQVSSEKLIFKSITPYLNKIIVLMTQWRYPQARATEIMSSEAPTKDFSDFLFKFSQSIASGEPVNLFIEKYHKNYMAEFEALRLQAMVRLKTLSDAYLPMLSITLFMTTTMLISSIFYDAKIMIMIAIMVVICVSFILYLLSWLIFQASKPDAILVQEQKEKPPTRQRVEYAAVMCLVLSCLVLLIPFENYFMHFVLIGVILFFGGLIGRTYVNNVKKKESDYPTFFRYMASNLSANIPLAQILQSASETDFGSLNSVIQSLNNKIKMRVEPKIAWWGFETEIDSTLIRRVNTIMTDTIYTGGDLGVASKFIEEFYHLYTTIRSQRYAAVGYHVGLVIPLYVVSAALFAVIDGFFSSLIDFIGEMASILDFFSVPDVAFMRLFFVFALALFALNNVFSIYNMEGDSRFTVIFYTGMQMTLGGIVYLIVSEAVTNYLAGVATF
ncbi:type II secretion system F family protein [Candidatus Bathyarchaeota archaeon]|nr:type II secretion system F family protein [Candidatus Bathyarchaeota archaeon]